MDALDRITPAPRLGERLVVRYLLLDESATDVIGWLTSVDSDRLLLQDHHGRMVTVSRDRIAAARRVPAARGGRDPQLTTAEDLERIALPGWVAEREPLGEWTLRAGGGFTGRANSCLAVGDPHLPVVDAAGRVLRYALEHGIPGWVQVIAGSQPEQELRKIGWRDVYVASDVLVCRLADLLGDALPDPRVRVVEDLEPEWTAAYVLSRPTAAEPALLRKLLESDPPRAFASVEQEGRLTAIGRGHVSSDWLGVTTVWTAPDSRRRGWAGLIMNALGHWAARLGARHVYLQVAVENEPARHAYEQAGFTRHHRYLYLRPPQETEPAEPSGSTSDSVDRRQRAMPSL
jgi:ribosomal protein S18 acetylase RimI-like enzyme